MAAVKPKHQQEKTWPTKTIQVTFSLYPGDTQMLEELKEHIGSSASDVARTAIRTLYVKVLGKSA